MIFKIAYQGIQVVEVRAQSSKLAEQKFWDAELNDLYNSEIIEIVRQDKPFENYTDLN